MRNAANHPGAPFDFSHHPECAPAARPAEPPAPGEVEIRYLGAAGLYLSWGEDSILLGPFFSNPGLPRVLLGEWRADDAAIQRGLAGIDVPAVEAVFAGHSHYDHIGDLPVVLGMADRAQVFVNRTGVHALAPYAAGRGNALEDAQDWVWLKGKGGERRPIRFRAVLSDHAPQVDHYLWRGGELKDDWKKPWSDHYFHDLKAGQPFALVIDLMSGDTPCAIGSIIRTPRTRGGSASLPFSTAAPTISRCCASPPMTRLRVSPSRSSIGCGRATCW